MTFAYEPEDISPLVERKVIHEPPTRDASMRQRKQWRADQIGCLQGGIFHGTRYLDGTLVPVLEPDLSRGSQ
jgi:hypothetical protein